MIKGYKCFNKDFTNRYGSTFEVGKTYHCNGEIKFGNNGNGFHMCKRLEDTLRYFDAVDDEVIICEVTGHGKYAEGKDDYYEYYDMYSCEYITIDKRLSRDEIRDYGLNLSYHRAKRFVSSYHLNPSELQMFKNKFQDDIDVYKAILYYQEGQTNIYNKNEVKIRERML